MNVNKTIVGMFGFVGLVLMSTAQARQLPLTHISDPSCKSLHRSEHSDDCKLPFVLPKETVISGAGNTTEKLLFSVLYESSYHTNDGVSGGHPGIDIVSAKGTPVMAIHDGLVTSSKNGNGYGNHIVIMHTDGDEIVYSNYSHLDVAHVELDEYVTEGQVIGEIGNTGFTIGPLGNHLDFQITTDYSPSHPYAYRDCEAGYMNAVQQGLCKTKLYTATHNPFEFLHAKISDHRATTSIIPKKVNKIDAAPTVKKEVEQKSSIIDSLDLAEVVSKPVTPAPVTPKIKQETVKKQAPVVAKPTLPFGITSSLSTDSLSAGRLGKLSFGLTDTQGKPISGLLPDTVRVEIDSQKIKMIIDEFQFVSNGKKQLLFQTLAPGKTTLSIYVNDILIESYDLMIN